MRPFFEAKGDATFLRASGHLQEDLIRSVAPDGEFEIQDIFTSISNLDQANIESVLEVVLDHPLHVLQDYWTQSILEDFDALQSEIRNFSALHAAFIGTHDTSTENTVPPYLFQCHICRNENHQNHFHSLTELKQHIEQQHHQSPSDDELLEYIKDSTSLTHYTGLRIEDETHCTTTEANEEIKLFGWYCRAPGCSACGQTLEEFIEHQQTAHNDKFTNLHPLWANILRHIVQKHKIPTMDELFSKRTFTNITINDGTQEETHILSDEHKTLESLRNLEIDQQHEIVNFTNNGTIVETPTFTFVRGTPADYNMRTFIQINELDETFYDPPNKEHVDFIHDLHDPDWEYESIHERTIAEETEHADDPGNETFDVIEEIPQLESLIEEIINTLQEIETCETLNDFIGRLINVRFSDEIRELISEGAEYDSILLQYLDTTHTLPKAGNSSPYIDDEDTYNSPKQIKQKVIQRERWTQATSLDLSDVYYFPLSGEGRWRGETHELAIVMDENPHFCSFLDCDYFTTGTKRTTHESNGKHARTIQGHTMSEKQLVTRFGYFWGPHIAYTWKHSELAPISSLRHEGEKIYTCNHEHCSCFFNSEGNLAQHCRSVHNLPMPNHFQPNETQIGQIVWITRERELELQEEERRRNAANNARPLTEQANASTQAQTQTQTQDNNNNNMTPQNDTNQQAQDAHESNIAHTLADDNNQTGHEIDNDRLIAQARQWCTEGREKEDKSLCIPTMTKQRRKAIKADLKTLYTTTIIPYMQRYMPRDDSEDERIKLDGVVYKINDILREHCRRKLGIKASNMTRRPTNPRRSTPASREEARINTELSILNDSVKTIKVLTEYKTILEEIGDESNANQAQTNRLNILKEKLETILHQREEDWNRAVFGGNAVEDIVNTARDIQHFESRVGWLRAKIDELAPTSRRRQEVIREMLRDNPRKCLNRYVFPKTTPECPLTPDDFAQHYGPQWATAIDGLPRNNEDEWGLDVTITEGNAERFHSHIKDKKAIADIVKSRNHLSAHGRDALSNAVFSLCHEESSTFLSLLFEAIEITHHVPESWKTTKTVMLYKKNNPEEPANWRPIGITSTMYRIFTAHLAKFIQGENKRNPIFHRAQRGFIANGGGPSDHINTLNELLYHAQRTNSECVLIAIDFTNAFGSVDHNLIFDSLERKGICQSFIDIVKDIYTENSTTIDIGGRRSEKIQWSRGVLQGCPLSPLLFNACLDPLLTHIERHNHDDGIKFTHNDTEYTITAQAYADDVVLIARDIDSARHEISSLEEFAARTGINIAPHKCMAIMRTHTENPQIQICGTNIPIRRTSESITYLGAPISGNKSTRIKFASPEMSEAMNKVKLLFKSQLTITQKLQALKSFILPKLDYLLANGQVGQEQTQTLDSFIRGRIMAELNANNIPKDFIHMESKRGGLGVQETTERAQTLTLASFIKQVLSKQEHVRALARTTIAEEEMSRVITKLEDEDEEHIFLDWKIVDGNVEEVYPRNRTNCTVNRAFEAAKTINARLTVQSDHVTLTIGEQTPIIIRDNVQIMKTINSNLQNLRIEKAIDEYPTRLHSFTGDTTSESHPFRSNRPINDNLFKFLIRARTNTLPTPANLAAWGRSQNASCPICNNPTATLAHILNACRPARFQQYTWRHNLVCHTLKSEIVQKYNPQYLTENSTIDMRRIIEDVEAQDIPAELQVLKPDIVFIDPDTSVMHIIEVTIPYNQVVRREDEVKNTLDLRQSEKEEKYKPLAQYIRDNTNHEVSIKTIVVSSLGHITRKTKSNIMQLFGKKGHKIAESISKMVIQASAVIYTNKTPKSFGFNPAIQPPENMNREGSINARENNPNGEEGVDATSTQSAQNPTQVPAEGEQNTNTQTQEQQEATQQNQTQGNNDQMTQNTQSTQETPEMEENNQNGRTEGENREEEQNEEERETQNTGDTSESQTEETEQTEQTEETEQTVEQNINIPDPLEDYEGFLE